MGEGGRRPGEGFSFGLGCYKDAAPDGAGNRHCQMQFGMDERGKGRLNFYCAKNAKAAKSVGLLFLHLSKKLTKCSLTK
jgi:hypothetical protein